VRSNIKIDFLILCSKRTLLTFRFVTGKLRLFGQVKKTWGNLVSFVKSEEKKKKKN